MATITIPIVLDASATATIFSEDTPTTDVSYVFDLSAIKLSAEDLSGFIRYIDQDDGTALFTYSTTGREKVRNNLHLDICNVELVHKDGNFPNNNAKCSNGTMGEMLVKYIASVLFGHPEAQAPIKNDAAIIHAVQTTSNIHGQFVEELTEGLFADATTDLSGRSNVVVQSIFEQLVTYSSTIDASSSLFPDDNRFGDISHTDVFTGMPFRTGDTIIFLVQMSGKLTTDAQNSMPSPFFTPSTLPQLKLLFGNNPDLRGTNKDELVPKIWEIRVRLT